MKRKKFILISLFSLLGFTLKPNKLFSFNKLSTNQKMLLKISGDTLIGHGPIKMFYPGLALGKTDTGIASIGRIDHALFEGDTIIRMHPHVNDEILTYLRSGYVEHLDSEGFKKNLNSATLMLMKAGHSFYHEEKIINKGEPLEALQIFIRPKQKNLKPVVTFLELENTVSNNKWRLIASPTEETTLQFTSHTWIYDIKLDNNKKLTLPDLAKENLTCLLYVFNGKINVNNTIGLSKKDSLLIKNEEITIETTEETELVLFVTDEEMEHYDDGMFSGNQA